MTNACKTNFRNQNFRGFQGPPFLNNFRRPKYNVPLNVIETDEKYEVHLYATGFSKEQITVNVADDILWMFGSKDLENAPNFMMQEFPIKNFERKLALNAQVNVDEITAKSEDGILKITLPKSEQALKKEHKVEVK